MSDLPKFKRFAEKVGDVTIWQEDGPHIETDCFRVAVQHDGKEVDLEGECGTPGEALDLAIRWATHRGLEVQWMTHRFHLIRRVDLKKRSQR
jgi:hypothetical protein